MVPISISAEPWQEQQKQGCCTRGEATVERKSVQLAWHHHHCVHRFLFSSPSKSFRAQLLLIINRYLHATALETTKVLGYL